MAYKYLDQTGLALVWQKIKNNFDKNVIEGIQINGTTVSPVNKIVNIPNVQGATASSAGTQGLVPAPALGQQEMFLRGDGNWAAPIGSTYAAGTGLSLSGTTMNHSNSLGSSSTGAKGDTSNQTPTWGGTFKVTSASADAQGHLTTFGEHTVKIPNSVATTAAAGLMSAEDKATLQNIVTTGGEPNQNAFSNIAVGSSTVAADSTTDTLTLTGSGSISISANTSTDTITISGANTTYAAGSGLTLSDTTFNHTNSITASTVGPTSNVTGASVAIPNVKYDAQGHITGGSTVEYTVGSLAASAITSGTFATARIPNLPASVITEGTFSSAIHASTPGATYSLVNKQYVDSAISSAISGAAAFQGTIDGNNDPYSSGVNYKAGYYWLVIEEGSYIDSTIYAYPGDMIFAISNKNSIASTADFTAIQQNLSPLSSDDIDTICV